MLLQSLHESSTAVYYEVLPSEDVLPKIISGPKNYYHKVLFTLMSKDFMADQHIPP
jgi:hypothetical protein